jgi:hypothetical protein
MNNIAQTIPAKGRQIATVEKQFQFALALDAPSLGIEKPPAQGRGSFSSHGVTSPLSARWTRNNAPFKFARATVGNDERQKVAALGAFERLHQVPSGDRRDSFYDPLDIASDAHCLRNHGCCHFPFATFAMASICSLGNFLIA